MSTWVKLTFLLLILAVLMIPISVAIPFIYENRGLLIAIISYLLLYGYLLIYVVIGDKTVYEKFSRKQRLIFNTGLLWGPLMLGFCLSLFTPFFSDLLAYEIQTREFQVQKIEPYAKSFRHLSKLYVVDINGNETSFVIKDEFLNMLQLQANGKLVIKGRSSIAGFVIDNINSVERD